jgi:hypothetical protein
MDDLIRRASQFNWTNTLQCGLTIA